MSRDKKKFICVILILILDINGAKGLPHRWYGDPEVSETNSSFASYPKPRNTDQYFTQRKILSKGNFASNADDVASRSDGKIIFPSDDIFADIQTSKYTIPVIKPTCEKATYCENVQNYPNDIVEAVLRQNKNLKLLSGVDLVPDVVHRVNVPPEDTSLCESQEKVVYPKVAESKDKEWLFVVNHENFTQGVRVETCGCVTRLSLAAGFSAAPQPFIIGVKIFTLSPSQKENSDCSLIDGFAEGYKTVCKQKYIYRQLVAVSALGEFKPETFRFPASCCCHIKFVGNPFPRIGIATKKTELPTSPKK